MAHVAPKAVGAADYQIVRTAVQVLGPGLVTDKTTSDSKVFGRYVKLEESNEPSWLEDSYIARRKMQFSERTEYPPH